jgi:hypothetical protein
MMTVIGSRTESCCVALGLEFASRSFGCARCFKSGSSGAEKLDMLATTSEKSRSLEETGDRTFTILALECRALAARR